MRAKWYERRSVAVLVLAVFGVLYGLISLPNHFLLRTYALDLGLYTNAIWQYAHGRTVLMGEGHPILADHFDLYLPILSPLVYVFGTWTLLLVQLISLIAGAWGTRLLLRQMGFTPGMSLLGMTLSLVFFGVFAAVAFDYHSNVVAAAVLPWFLLHIWRGAKWRAILLFVLMLAGKENMGFWLGPLALVLAFDRNLPRPTRRLSAVLGLGGLLWSVMIIGCIMPALSSNSHYMHFDYAILGHSLGEALGTMLVHPATMIKALFIGPLGIENGTAIKLEFWWMMLLGGGWAMLIAPRWGLAALPLIAQKMLHDDPGKWSVVAHYGVEFAPLVAIAVPTVLSRVRNTRAQTWLCACALTGAISCSIHFMDLTIAYQDRSRVRFYKAEHYTKPYSIATFYDLLDRIPDNAPVSAQSPAVPHFALRERVYEFPVIKDAVHVVLLPKESSYPLDTAGYRKAVLDLMHSPEWVMTDTIGSVLHFERR